MFVVQSIFQPGNQIDWRVYSEASQQSLKFYQRKRLVEDRANSLIARGVSEATAWKWAEAEIWQEMQEQKGIK